MIFFKWWKRSSQSSSLVVPEDCHDLMAIYHQINQRYFEGKIDIPISWFGAKTARARCKVLLGSYHLDKKCIKINRILDRPDVPHYYISFIVYHEMLHHLFPPVMTKKRRKIHHPRFKVEERRFEEYDLAMHFARCHKNLWFLLP